MITFKRGNIKSRLFRAIRPETTLSHQKLKVKENKFFEEFSKIKLRNQRKKTEFMNIKRRRVKTEKSDRVKKSLEFIDTKKRKTNLIKFASGRKLSYKTKSKSNQTPKKINTGRVLSYFRRVTNNKINEGYYYQNGVGHLFRQKKSVAIKINQ